MSAYNIMTTDYTSIKTNADEVLMCMAKKDLLNRKLGVGKELNEKDMTFVLFANNLITNEGCSMIAEEGCLLNKINSLLYKYK